MGSRMDIEAFGLCPGRVLMSHMVDFFVASTLISTELHQPALPPAVNVSSSFPRSVPKFAICFLGLSHSDWDLGRKKNREGVKGKE